MNKTVTNMNNKRLHYFGVILLIIKDYSNNNGMINVLSNKAGECSQSFPVTYDRVIYNNNLFTIVYDTSQRQQTL